MITLICVEGLLIDLKDVSVEDLHDVCAKWAVAISEMDYDLKMWRNELAHREHVVRVIPKKSKFPRDAEDDETVVEWIKREVKERYQIETLRSDSLDSLVEGWEIVGYMSDEGVTKGDN